MDACCTGTVQCNDGPGGTDGPALAQVGAHAGQCLTNSVMHTLQTELAERLDANQAIMRLLSRDMSDEHMAATIATEAGLAYGASRCSFFLVKVRALVAARQTKERGEWVHEKRRTGCVRTDMPTCVCTGCSTPLFLT